MVKLTKAAISERLSARFKDTRFKRLGELPGPEAFLGMERGVERIVRAMEARESIAIIGDYDVDGVVASTILAHYLERVGAVCEVVIPNRFEDGYGLSAGVLERVRASLIVTVDNGIAAFEAGRLCQERGMDLIITDHHTPQERLPECYALINPKQPHCPFPYKEISGAQVAWYLAGGIKRALGDETDLAEYLDLLCIAIIADVMPLKEINRLMVQAGLARLAKSKRPAARVLGRALGKARFGAEDIAYLIAPLLNSAGRMEDAMRAYRFLRAESEDEAGALLLALQELNSRRKMEEQELLHLCEAQVRPEDAVVIAHGECWHEGVVGIVAARMAQRHKKPALIFSCKNGIAKGSGRSALGADLFSFLERLGHYFVGFGGHKEAAGMTLEYSRFETFCQEARLLAHTFFVSEGMQSGDEALLGELAMEEIDGELLGLLRQFEPYGASNPRPKFRASSWSVLSCSHFGRDRSHTRLQLLGEKGAVREGVMFRARLELQKAQRVSCVYSLSEEQYPHEGSPKLLLHEVFKI